MYNELVFKARCVNFPGLGSSGFRVFLCLQLRPLPVFILSPGNGSLLSPSMIFRYWIFPVNGILP